MIRQHRFYAFQVRFCYNVVRSVRTPEVSALILATQDVVVYRIDVYLSREATSACSCGRKARSIHYPLNLKPRSGDSSVTVWIISRNCSPSAVAASRLEITCFLILQVGTCSYLRSSLRDYGVEFNVVDFEYWGMRWGYFYRIYTNFNND
jgi:hypothetical protein